MTFYYCSFKRLFAQSQYTYTASGQKTLSASECGSPFLILKMVTNPAINDIIRISEFFNRGDGLKKYKYSTKNIVIAISFSVLWCVLAFYLIFVCSRNGSVLGAAMLFGISMVCPAVYVIILSVKSRHNFVELHDEYFTYSVDGAKGQVDYSDIAAIVLRGSKKIRSLSSMNVYTTKKEQFIPLSNSYDDYKELWKAIILKYKEKSPDTYSVDIKLVEILHLTNV